MASLVEAPSKQPPAGKVSYEEFLAWADEDTWAEWVDGEVVVLSPSSAAHQEIVSLLLWLLKLLVERQGHGWVCMAPFQMRLANQARGREPDILYVRDERRHLVRNTHLDGAADLVVEVTSPESIGRDRGEKFVEYEAAGVQEYWLIDPDRQQVELYRLGPNGRYALSPLEADGTLRSSVLPGFWLRPEWLWQKPLPPATSLARQLGLL